MKPCVRRRRRWSVTHPISRSHHGLLLAAQFVEDVVGKLDAARPQLSCRDGHRIRGCVREREGGRRVHRMWVCVVGRLFRGRTVDNRRKKKKNYLQLVEDSGFPCIIKSNDYHLVLCKRNTVLTVWFPGCAVKQFSRGHCYQENTEWVMWQRVCHKVYLDQSIQCIPVVHCCPFKIIQAELISFLITSWPHFSKRCWIYTNFFPFRKTSGQHSLQQ